jgi:oligopeptide transport system substrate-binding protein
VPGVAERWEVSPDGLTYTFHLRADARWSNGDLVTATDFLRSWQRVLTPSLAADYANLLYVVQNAEAYHAGRETDFAAVGFAAPDARTLRITLEFPAPYFLSLLQHWMWFPIHLDSIAALGPTDRRGTAWARPGTLIGNGPFNLTRWDSGQRLIVEKSATYWDAATVRLNAIHFYPIDSVEAEERAFRSGQLHLTEAMPVSKIDTYRANDPHLLRIDPYLGTYFFRFNTRQAPLNNERVRRALSMAVDRVALVEKVLRGGQRPATALTPPGLPDYTPPDVVRTDPEAARALLVEAGFPGGKGLPPFEILFNTSGNHRLLAEAIQEMWRRELGVDVRLVNQEFKVVLAERRAGRFQILLSDWVGDYLDATTFLDLWRSDSGNNHTGWANAEYDALLFAAARNPDTTARAAQLQRAETIMLHATPAAPIYFNTHVFLLHPSVKGWHPTLLDHHPYKHVWLEP